MKLILLGTGGFIPTDQTQTACFMLPEAGILLDAGTGLYRMSKYLQTAELDIYLSHAHGDHSHRLAFLFAAFFVNEIQQLKANVDEINLWNLQDRANRLSHSTRVHATQPVIDSLAKGYEALNINWQVIGAQEPLPGGGTITSFSVSDGDEIGFRLDWPGHSMAYVTDTIAAPDAKYIKHIRGVDVLLHDCNGPSRLAKLMTSIHHSATLGVAQAAALAQVGQLILVHKNPIEAWSIDEDLDAARAIFPATVIGTDGMEIEF